MKIILFENSKVANLSPITLTRPTFDILCGGTTLYQLLKSQFQSAKLSFLVRPYLQALAKRKFGQPKSTNPQILLLDGSLVPSIAVTSDISRKIKSSSNLVFKKKNQVLGAYINLSKLKLGSQDVGSFKPDQLLTFLHKLKVKSVKVSWPTFDNLWDVITFNEEILPENLNYFKKDFKKVKPGVFVGKKVKIEDLVYFDTTDGPIVINDGSWIKSQAVLRGPLYIGKNCIINSHAEIKHSTCIGDVCKVGGEVEVSVFQGYSNKQHLGFLGNSYVGQWVNIGGGASNSDLKNTYSSVKMQGQETGKVFLGCVIGDYCKIAVNSTIFTGKVIGVNSCVYGVVTADVPSFTNAGNWLKNWVVVPLAVAHKVQAAVLLRRQIKAQASDRQLLADVFKLTTQDRKTAKVTSSILQLL